MSSTVVLSKRYNTALEEKPIQSKTVPRVLPKRLLSAEECHEQGLCVTCCVKPATHNLKTWCKDCWNKQSDFKYKVRQHY